MEISFETPKDKYLEYAHASGVLGEYAHEFSLEGEGGFAILFGPNGVGKTTFLELLDSTIKINGPSLISIPFSELNMSYSTGHRVHVEREVRRVLGPVEERPMSGDVYYDVDSDEVARSYEIIPNPDIETNDEIVITITLNDPDEELPITWKYSDDGFEKWVRNETSYENIHDDIWVHRKTGRSISTTTLLEQYQEFRKNRKIEASRPDSRIANFFRDVPSLLIETQRLRQDPNRRPLYASHAEESDHTPRIFDQADVLKQQLRRRQMIHSRLSQQIDQEFPNRILDLRSEGENLSLKNVKKRYLKQETFRERLDEIYIRMRPRSVFQLGENLEKLEDSDQQWKLKVVDLSLVNTDRKMEPFQEIVSKIDLFEEMVNGLLLNKRVQVNDKFGLVVHRINRDGNLGSVIPLDLLSSGEQHEIILLVDLLFRVKPNSLVMVDEPEISLHVDWQLSFMPNVKRIAKAVGFQIVVATHSPQIINSDWNRTFSLGEVPDDRNR